MISNQCVSVSRLARQADTVPLANDDATWTPELESAYRKASAECAKGGAVSLEEFQKGF